MLLAAIVALPLPSVIRARGVTDFEDKEPLFASQTAELTAAAPVNQLLLPDAVVLEFQSLDSQFELTEVRGQVAVLTEELKQLRLRSAIDPSTAYEIPVKSEELTELQGRERVLAREIAAMRHTAPTAGYLIAGPLQITAPITAPRDDRFSHHPLAPKQPGSDLRPQHSRRLVLAERADDTHRNRTGTGCASVSRLGCWQPSSGIQTSIKSAVVSFRESLPTRFARPRWS